MYQVVGIQDSSCKIKEKVIYLIQAVKCDNKGQDKLSKFSREFVVGENE